MATGSAGLAPQRVSAALVDSLSVQERLIIISEFERRRAGHMARNANLRLDELDACMDIVVLGLLKLAELRLPRPDVDVDLSAPGSFEISTPMGIR